MLRSIHGWAAGSPRDSSRRLSTMVSDNRRVGVQDRKRFVEKMNPVPEETFEPEITAFYCIYCGYMAADTAGALCIQYPANVKFVRLPCTGKTDIRYLLEAFEQGADGVYRGGLSDRQLPSRARQRARPGAACSGRKKFWTRLGWAASASTCSSCPAARATLSPGRQTMTERIRKLGPNPLETGVRGAERPAAKHFRRAGGRRFRGRR